MTEYQRFIAYLYEYGQDGAKVSAGHLRVELRQGKCQMTVRIRAKRMTGLCKLYFYIRKPNQVIGFLIGETNLVNGESEFNFKADASNLSGKKETFDQVSGLLLFGKGEEYLAADWNNKDITPTEAANINPNIKKKESETFDSAQKEQVLKQEQEQAEKQAEKQEEVLNQEKEVTEETKETKETEKASNQEGKLKEPLPDFWSAAKDIVKGLLTKEPEKQPLNHIASILRAGKEKEHQTLNEGSLETENVVKEQKETLHSDAVISVAEKRNGKNSNSFSAAITSFISDKKEQNIPKEVTDEKSILAEEQNTQEESKVKQPPKQVETPDIQGTQIESLNAAAKPYCKNRRMPWQDAPEARDILDTGVKMYPFQDGELAECVRMEPKDIGRLPIEYWNLGNNSFLLHGYCNYKYLLFAKRMNRIRCEYLIMIPGIYQTKERMMARMFGFEQFKCAKRREQRPGEFGYWYMTLIF